MSRVNLANRITLSRLVTSLALFGILLALQQGFVVRPPLAGWLAFAIFTLTAGTDWLDGHVARQRGEVTVLGRMMDPFVDKVLVCGTLVFLTAMIPHLVPPWMVVVIVGREFLVSGIRGYMESRGIEFSAKRAGKVKMMLQCFACAAALLVFAVGDPHAERLDWVATLTVALMWGAVVSTVYSGWVYSRVFWKQLDTLESH